MSAVRLQALSDAPDAFESTLRQELAWTTSDWRRWISHGAIFVLERSDRRMGIVAGVPHRSDRAAAFLESMWIHPELRGTGSASALVASVLAWAEAEGAAEVWLHVGERNDRARRFYARHGFRPTGNKIVRERDGLVEAEMRCTLGRARRDANRSAGPE
ncbi:MAG: GNAT family N-acetyltransferase [Planctomycetota bacterium]